MKIIDANNLPFEPVSHNPEIKKRVLTKNGEIPNITQISISYFQPGQIAPDHTHSDMSEVFKVEKGTATFIINGKEYQVEEGTTVIIEPTETHQLENRTKSELQLLQFGILV